MDTFLPKHDINIAAQKNIFQRKRDANILIYSAHAVYASTYNVISHYVQFFLERLGSTTEKTGSNKFRWNLSFKRKSCDRVPLHICRKS